MEGGYGPQPIHRSVTGNKWRKLNEEKKKKQFKQSLKFPLLPSLKDAIKNRFICPTVQSRAYGLEWLGVTCTTEIPSRIFIFFFRNETLLTLLNEYTQFFTILFFSFLAEIACGKIIITPFTSNGRENFGTTNITHFKNWVWGLGFGLEREVHFVLHMNHWPISLSLYQQRVLPRHWAFVPIKMALFFKCKNTSA